MAAQAQAGQCAFASLGQAGGPLPMGPSPDAGTPGRDFTWSGQGPAPVGTAQPHSLRQRLSSAGRPSHFTGPTCRSLVGGGCSNKARTVTAETHLDRMRAQPLGQLGGHPHSATGHFTFHRQAGLTSAPAGDGYTSSMGNASSTRSVIDPVKENRALGASL